MENLKAVRFVLDEQQMRLSARAGIERQIENILLGREPYHGADRPEARDWHYHVEGCMGEQVTCKYLGIPYHPKGIFRGPDAGPFDVRTSAFKSMKLYKEDKEKHGDKIFWCIYGKNGTYQVMGYAYCRDVAREEFWGEWPNRKNKFAYFVPFPELRPPWTIIEEQIFRDYVKQIHARRK